MTHEVEPGADGDESDHRTHPGNLQNILEAVQALQGDVDQIKRKLGIPG